MQRITLKYIMLLAMAIINLNAYGQTASDAMRNMPRAGSAATCPADLKGTEPGVAKCLEDCGDARITCFADANTLNTTHKNCTDEASHKYGQCVIRTGNHNTYGDCFIKHTADLTACNSIMLALGVRIASCYATATTCSGQCLGVSAFKECWDMFKKW